MKSKLFTPSLPLLIGLFKNPEFSNPEFLDLKLLDSEFVKVSSEDFGELVTFDWENDLFPWALSFKKLLQLLFLNEFCVLNPELTNLEFLNPLSEVFLRDGEIVEILELCCCEVEGAKKK